MNRETKADRIKSPLEGKQATLQKCGKTLLAAKKSKSHTTMTYTSIGSKTGVSG